MSTTKYIIKSESDKIYLGTSTVPVTLEGASGDKAGMMAVDGDYLYYCASDFVEAVPISISVSGGSPAHIYDAEPGTPWNNYGDNYLQVGPSQEGSVTPLNGWYMVDDNGTIRQIVGGFWFNPGEPSGNGTGWIMTLDGPFSYSVDNTTITLYETLPTVTITGNQGSGDIWRRVTLDKDPSITNVYRALLTQTGQITGHNLSEFAGGLIKGETYTINVYNEGDDFSNIAKVTSGTINQSGCEFIATGENPFNYSNGSELISGGGLVVEVLENTLGYDIDWQWAPFGGYGYYLGINADTGPVNNSFPRNNVSINCQSTQPFDWGYFPSLFIMSNHYSFGGKDNLLVVSVQDWDLGDQTDNALYYTPIEIKIKVDNNPIVINGDIQPSFPFNNSSYRLISNGLIISTYYANNPSIVNNITELVSLLNSDENTNFMGKFSDNGEGGVILTMTKELKQKISQDVPLTFQIFSD